MKLPQGLSVTSTSSASSESPALVCKLQKSLYDDIIVTGDDLKEISALKAFLDAQFKIKDLGLLNILLFQKKFISDFLSEYKCVDVSPTVSPLDMSHKLHSDVGDLLPHLESYRILRPRIPHMTAALHVLRYLKGTSDFGVLLNNYADLSLMASCDSDWVACPESRCSVSGFCIQLGGSLIN
uniref:Uncharacterized mitochondrial protein AtMg00810-like n=1 Tax=Nicotiana tabacum TaxID=4097 RepID=A0A1S4ATX3_TOBAC|nr:PREDICTED: uncharacterized mitochondrial protein AtMg00810-like [Nicotiana tabacum]